MFIVVCAWFIGLLASVRDFIHLGKCLRHERCLDYTCGSFLKQEVLRRRAARGSSSKSEYS